jgi:hypothetical protein
MVRGRQRRSACSATSDARTRPTVTAGGAPPFAAAAATARANASIAPRR